MSRSVRLGVLLALLPWTVVAQEALPRLPEILDMVQDSEVYLVGHLGSGAEGVRFGLDGTEGAFPVAFEGDAGLADAVKDCRYDAPCQVAAYGYVRWQGPVLQIVVTSIETIGP